MTFFMRAPICAGDREMLTPAASSALILSVAVPLPPEMMAPACPIRRPGGAVRPADMTCSASCSVPQWQHLLPGHIAALACTILQACRHEFGVCFLHLNSSVPTTSAGVQGTVCTHKAVQAAEVDAMVAVPAAILGMAWVEGIYAPCCIQQLARLPNA